jgi:ABC-type phosphate transport system substrate-binding protein
MISRPTAAMLVVAISALLSSCGNDDSNPTATQALFNDQVSCAFASSLYAQMTSSAADAKKMMDYGFKWRDDATKTAIALGRTGQEAEQDIQKFDVSGYQKKFVTLDASGNNPVLTDFGKSEVTRCKLDDALR